MNKIVVYNQSGKGIESLQLPKDILELKINNNLLHQVISSSLSNQRDSKANSKTRAQISGGGKKPWRQKGTGRARSGSIRNPLWIGGGTIFGPKMQKNYSKKINQKMNISAMKQAMIAKLKDGQIYLLDDLQFEKIKTRSALALLNNLPVKEGSILLVTDKKDKNIHLSFRNLPYCQASLANNINCLDIIKFSNIIMTKDALTTLCKKIFNNIELKFSKSQISEEKTLISGTIKSKKSSKSKKTKVN